jgi:superfamily II DNA helicase RecQ
LNGVPAFVIFSDATLRDMSVRMPTSEAQFRSVYGVGRVKTEKFGRKFMDEIEKYCKESGEATNVADIAETKRKNTAHEPKQKKTHISKAANSPTIHLSKDENGNYILPPAVDGDLFAALRTLRADLSSDFGIQSNVLASTDALAQISADCPVTLAELRKMAILPPRTEEFCGGEIVRTVRTHLEKCGEVIEKECDCPLTPDNSLLKELKALRNKISNCIYTPQNRIISNATLEKMSELKPVTRSQLVEKIHLGSSKCLIFGQVFAEVVRKYVGEIEQPDGFDGAPQADRALFLHLAELRHKCALSQDKTDISVMSDYTLYDMCIKKPQNDEDFRAVYGIGQFKSDKYSAEFTKSIANYLIKN